MIGTAYGAMLPRMTGPCAVICLSGVPELKIINGRSYGAC